MLVKIGNKWVEAKLIMDLECSRGSVNGSIGYILLARGAGRDYLCGEYETEAEVIKAMDEAAEKINAAQGHKPAVEEKTTMKHMVYNGDEGDNIYACSCCKTWMQAYRWYKYCPNCGGEIKGWD